MAEHKKDHAADAKRVAMSQKHEVTYWTKAHLKKTGVIK